MGYELREAVDYIINLYRDTVVSQEASQYGLKHALNNRILEYHPDRYHGIAL